MMNLDNKGGSESGGAGIGFFGILTIVFIILKLCHIIEWSWVWVLSPIWIGLLLIVAVIVIIALLNR